VQVVRSKNPEAEIVWLLHWAYPPANKDDKRFALYDYSSSKMSSELLRTAKIACSQYGLSRIVPVGPAIEDLRKTRLNDELDLTRDGYHLNLKYSRFTAACAYYQAQIYPFTKVSIRKDKATLEGTNFALTEKDAKLCRKVAARAVKRFKN